MVSVSLQSFVSTGAFGPISLGCTAAELGRCFGDPEATGGTSRKQRRPTIWKYGDVEFYFPPGGSRLEMIHIDRFSGPGGIPSGWGGLSVDPWVIRLGLSQDEFARAAEIAGLQFTSRREPSTGQAVIELAGGVRIGFVAEPYEFSDFVGLAWVTCRA